MSTFFFFFVVIDTFFFCSFVFFLLDPFPLKKIRMQKEYLRKKIEDLKLLKKSVEEKVKQKEQEIQKYFYLYEIRSRNSVTSQQDARLSQNIKKNLHNGVTTASVGNVGVSSNTLRSASLLTSLGSAEKNKEVIVNDIHAGRTRCCASNAGHISSTGSSTNKISSSRLIHRETERFVGSPPKNSMSSSFDITPHSNSIASSFFRPSRDFLTSPGEEMFSKDYLRSLSPIQCSRWNRSSEFPLVLDKEECLSPSRIDLGVALEKAGFQMNLDGKAFYDRKTPIRRVRFISPSFPRSQSATENVRRHYSSTSVFSCVDSHRNFNSRNLDEGTYRCADVRQDGQKDYAHREKILKEKVGLVMETIEACRVSIEGAGSHFPSLSSTISSFSTSRASQSFFSPDHSHSPSSPIPISSLPVVCEYGRKTAPSISGELATVYNKSIVHDEGGCNVEEEDAAHPSHASFCAVRKSSEITSVEHGDYEKRGLYSSSPSQPYTSSLTSSVPKRKRPRTPVGVKKSIAEKALVNNACIPESSTLVATFSSSPTGSIVHAPCLEQCDEKGVEGLVNRRPTEPYRKVLFAKSLRTLSKKEKSKASKNFEERESRYSNVTKTFVSSLQASRGRFSVSAVGMEKEGILPSITLPCGSTVFFE